MSEEDLTSLKLLTGEKLYTGPKSTFISRNDLIKVLKSISLSKSKLENEIAYLAVQIVRSCNPKNLSSLLSILSCFFCRTSAGEIDVSILTSLQQSSESHSKVCAKVFKKGINL